MIKFLRGWSTVALMVLLTSLLFTQCTMLDKLLGEDEKDDKKEEQEINDPKQLIKIADRMFELGGYFSASEYYAKACSLEPKNVYAHYQLAESHFLARDYQSAEVAYKKVIENDETDRYPLAYYKYGQMQKMNGHYTAARETFEQFKEEPLMNLRRIDYSIYREYLNNVRNQLEGLEFAIQAVENPIPMDIEYAGDEVNCAYTDLSPLPVGENRLIYASMAVDSVVVVNPNKENKFPTAHFYQAEKVNGQWTNVEPLPGPFNKPGVHTANGSFSPNGERFYFTRCDHSAKAGRVLCKIYYSKKKDGQWQEPQKLGEGVNYPEHTSTHPSIGTFQRGTREYEVLYLASDRPGGRGGMDIWYAIKSFRSDEFRDARNLGRKINTESDEITPFFDTNTNTLYFSSEGHVGLGGFDIYKTEGQGRRWSDPENLGYPINSSVDDIYYVLRDETTGFVVSNRPEGGFAIKSPTCCDDIYEFKYHKVLRFALTGSVFDAEDTTKRLHNVAVSLYRLQETINEEDTTEKQVEEILLATDSIARTDTNYFFKLKANRNYLIAGVKSNYLTAKAKVSTMGLTESDTLVKHLYMDSIIKQKAFVIKNIYYDFDKATLQEVSIPALDSLVMFLEDNPQLIVEISSHTDSVGSDAYNMQLSQRRAESVVNFLLEAGIDEERLVPQGYGEDRPIAPNSKPDGSDNPEGRAKNRRTEFQIIGELEDVELRYDDGFIGGDEAFEE